MPAMTKLEAVNEMLLAIGQAPVNTLEVAGIRDVSVAALLLDNVSREVQSEGHSFNTFEVTLTPDVNGFLIVAPDVLQIDSLEGWRWDVIPRVDPQDGVNKLYDRKARTFIATDPVEVEVVKLLPFESLPQHARRYIVAMAKLRFQASVVGSTMLNGLIEQEVGMAYANFRKAELLQQDNNMLNGNPTIINRNRHRLRRYG